jgi:hypothetical protein
MGQKQSFLTSQQKPDSPTKKWAPPLLFFSNHIYNNFCADLLSLAILQEAMCPDNQKLASSKQGTNEDQK